MLIISKPLVFHSIFPRPFNKTNALSCGAKNSRIETMKNLIGSIIMLSLVLGVTSCRTSPPSGGEMTLPSEVSNARRDAPEDVLVGVGNARMQTIAMSRTTAATRARAEISQSLNTMVQNMVRDYTAGSELDPAAVLAFQENITVALSRSDLRGSVIHWEGSDAEGNWWVVMHLNRGNVVNEITQAQSAARLAVPAMASFDAEARMSEAFERLRADTNIPHAAAPTTVPGAEWTRAPYTRFDERVYLAAVGMGSSRTIAERNAMSELVSIFGRGIHIDERISLSYQEAVRSGVTVNWSETTTVDQVITSTAGMDLLVGAEIADTYRDSRGNYHAVAVLNRARAVRLYSEMVRANLEAINNLVTPIPAQIISMK